MNFNNEFIITTKLILTMKILKINKTNMLKIRKINKILLFDTRKIMKNIIIIINRKLIEKK